MAGWADYLQQLLNEEPKLAYYADLYGQPRSPNQLKFGQNAYQDIYNQYFGALGQQIMGGQDPTLKFQDFLSQSPFSQRFANLPPGLTGRSDAQRLYNPSTQWRV